MERSDGWETIEQGAGAAAVAPSAAWVWFGFAYLPPASLAGREARMC